MNKMTKNSEKILKELTRLCEEEKSCTKTNSYFANKLGVTTKIVQG